MFNGNTKIYIYVFLDEHKNVLLLNLTFNSLGSVRLFDVFESLLDASILVTNTVKTVIL